VDWDSNGDAHGHGDEVVALDDDFGVAVAGAGTGAGTGVSASSGAGTRGFAAAVGFFGGVDVDGDYVDDIWGGTRRWGWCWERGRGWWWLDDDGWWWCGWAEDDWSGRGRWWWWDDGGYFAAGFPDARLRGVGEVEALFVTVFAWVRIHVWYGGVGSSRG